MDKQPRPSVWCGVKAIFRVAAFLCRGMAFSAEVFLHGWFGPKYIGAQAVAVPAILLAYALCWPRRNVILLFAFLAAYIGMCAGALIGVSNRQKRCDQLPDTYSGHPRSMGTIRFVNERWTKRILEPIYVALAGSLIQLFDAPLGVYLMIVSVALFLSVNATWVFRHKCWRERMHDPNKPRPLRVQVRRITRDHAEQLCTPRSSPAYGGRP